MPMITTRSKGKLILQGAALVIVLWYLFGGLARAECPLTKPVVVSATQADYYASMRWEMTATFRGPAPFYGPDMFEPISAFMWDYSFNWANRGPLVTVNLQNPTGTTQVDWFFSGNSRDSEGCYVATYSDTSVNDVVNDAPEQPSFCVPNPEFPALCLARGLEGAGLEIVDTAGNDSGPVNDTTPCFHTGRGADCVH